MKQLDGSNATGPADVKRDVYSGLSELQGEEHEDTLRAANNYASSLRDLRRFEEAKVTAAVLRKTMPVAQRRSCGESDARVTLSRRGRGEQFGKRAGALACAGTQVRRHASKISWGAKP